MRLLPGLLLALFLFSAEKANATNLDWASSPATNLLAGSDVNTTTGITITTSATSTGAFDGGNSVNIVPAGARNGSAVGIIDMIMDATNDNNVAYQTTTISFSRPVYNLTFIVRDIDGGPAYNGLWNDNVDFNSNVGVPTSGIPASGVAYNSTTGRASSISNTNTTTATGNITVTWTGPVTSVTVRHYSGSVSGTPTNPANQVIAIDDLSFKKQPALAVRKSSTGGSGPNTFDFTVSNSGTGTTATSITTSGAATTGSSIFLNAVNTATTITETGPSGWSIVPANATCTDSNSASSGNPSSFSATVSGSVVTVPAANIVLDAVITCAFSNARLPAIQLAKISIGTTGSFDFSGDNGVGSDTIVTTSAGTPAYGAVRSFTNASTVTTITETIPAGWVATSGTCTGTSASNVSFTPATGKLVLNAAATASPNSLVCTITNTKLPELTLVKSITNDNGGTASVSSFPLTAAGPSTISGVSGSPAVTDQFVPLGTYALSETNLAGYAAGSWGCTAGSVSGANLTLAAADIAICTIVNNDIAPTLTLRKTSLGGVATFNFSANNGFGTDAITTVTAGTPASGTTKSLLMANTVTDFTETQTPAYFMNGAPTCTGMGSGGSVTLVSGSTYRLNAAATPLAASIVCTFTNTKAVPQLTILKTPSTTGPVGAGALITYTYKVTNTGNVPMTALAVTDTHNGSGSFVGVASEVLLTDAAPTGDSSDAAANGIWDSLAPGDVITFKATYTVTQNDVDYLQ